jgi:hypothetical protein
MTFEECTMPRTTARVTKYSHHHTKITRAYSLQRYRIFTESLSCPWLGTPGVLVKVQGVDWYRMRISIIIRLI